MTVFGFLATIVLCLTAVLIVCILIKHPMHTHVHQYLHQVHEGEEPVEEIEAPEEVVDTEAKQMDAVIAAVNELMGIETEDNNASK
jgi:CBS-domain-containing membrane protein